MSGPWLVDGASAPSVVNVDPAREFEDFYRREVEWARRLAFVLVADAEAANDIAHDGFARLQRRYPRLRNPRAYLRVTIVNLCRRHSRSEARRRGATDALGCSAVVSAPSLELLDLIDRLPYRQRAVLVLRYFEDLSEADIAESLGCRPGTVKSLAARALDQLRKELIK
ncbi:MAG: sigma-70 family RNA polymerase sigma factor [Actinobacteria bacterium]|nr:sigma-70 family RNA polymerase sigma factor [Actinomycetota bacterium]